MKCIQSWGVFACEHPPAGAFLDQRLAPAHCHQEADERDATTHCEVPLAQLRDRVGGARNVEDNDPQQAHNHERREQRSPPHGRERNTIGPGVNLRLGLSGCTLRSLRTLVALCLIALAGMFT